MKNFISIDENICLKALVPTDAITMYNLIAKQREYLSEWLPFVQFTKKIDDTRGFVEMAILKQRKKQDFVYKICFEDRMIGVLGTKETDHINKNTELGYWLSEEFQNMGIMTKAVDTLTKSLFTELKLERIQICCAIGNDRSMAIPTKLGFKLEGIRRNGEWLGNLKFRDLLVYSKLRADLN